MSATAVTTAPSSLSSWIAAEPIAPVPPMTSTRCPSLILALVMSERA